MWYYMLRDLDPHQSRYRAVILATDDYDDEDRAYNPNDEIRDLHYLVARLRLTDLFDFAFSYEDRALRWQAIRGGLLKGTILQADIQAFLRNPNHRIEYVKLCNRYYWKWAYDYKETTRNMEGLKIDWSTLAVTLPPGAGEDERHTVEDFLAHPAEPQTGRLSAYRKKWLGRIIESYRNSGTTVIFIRLPRGPVPRPDGLSKKLTSSIRDFGSLPNVALANEHTFDALEHPGLFKDGIHLNREGITRFSALLVEEVNRLLETHKAAQP